MTVSGGKWNRLNEFFKLFKVKIPLYLSITSSNASSSGISPITLFHPEHLIRAYFSKLIPSLERWNDSRILRRKEMEPYLHVLPTNWGRTGQIIGLTVLGYLLMLLLLRMAGKH